MPSCYGEEHENYRKQLDYELDMIEKMGFTDYFLIVADFVNYATRRRASRSGPGAARPAGSMVSYCLHITDIDPMQYSLYFERFLNPERVSMPDIDMDFGDTRRGEVVDYVRRKYGDDHVAQIVTFGTMAARGAIRDVGRALNMTVCRGGRRGQARCRRTPAHHAGRGAASCPSSCATCYEADERVQTLIDTAQRPRGHAAPRVDARGGRRHHEAAGVRICPARDERRHRSSANTP